MATITVTPEVAEALVVFFEAVAAEPLPEGTPRDTFEAFGHHMARARREDALALVAAFSGPAPYEIEDGARNQAVRELVDRVMWLRASKHASPDFDHERARGGIIMRMLGHDQSPDADALDQLALAIVNGDPSLDNHTRLRMMI